MGSVAKVRKRASAVGGSARKSVQEAVRREKKEKECLKIPVLGWFFRFCIDGVLKQSEDPWSRTDSIGSGSEDFTSSSILKTKGDLLITSSMKSASSERSKFGIVTNLPIDLKSYAMKSIHLNRVTHATFVTELKNEIAILKKLDHPHIVRAMETFEHRNQIFIVMELCYGGDLYSRDPYTEEAAARIVSSILSALAYMHDHNVTHRDLKYENIMFVNDTPTAEVKLIDFGLSKVYGDNAQLTEGVGTIYTMAPEVLKGNYTQISDVWSMGVVAYMLLSSQMVSKAKYDLARFIGIRKFQN
jgi:serine/threonine protein kinase